MIGCSLIVKTWMGIGVPDTGAKWELHSVLKVRPFDFVYGRLEDIDEWERAGNPRVRFPGKCAIILSPDMTEAEATQTFMPTAYLEAPEALENTPVKEKIIVQRRRKLLQVPTWAHKFRWSRGTILQQTVDIGPPKPRHLSQARDKLKRQILQAKINDRIRRDVLAGRRPGDDIRDNSLWRDAMKMEAERQRYGIVLP